MEGVIKFYNSKKGFGFLTCQGKDYFFHISDMQTNSKIDKGDKVTFETHETQKGTKAVKVRKIS